MATTGSASTDSLVSSTTATTATTATSTPTTNSDSPYYLHPSDNPGSLITPVLLKGDNYSEWATEFYNSLQAKRKIGFIDGVIQKPDTDPDLSRWIAANSMIVGWMRTSIDPLVRSTVSHIPDAYQLWESLKRRFSIRNGVRKHLIQDEITNCKQNGDTVLTYYGRLSKLWEELQSFQPILSCTCAASSIIEKEKEDAKVHKFLFGLDDSRFSTIRSQIIDEEPLPDLNLAYSRVIRAEQHLQTMRATESKQDIVGFSAKTKSPVSTNHSPTAAAINSFRSRDPNRFCTHCNRKGHEASECFLLHGYPDWFNEQQQRMGQSSTRGGRGRGRGRANTSRTTPATPTGTSLQSDQITALINLLQNQQTQLSTDKMTGPFYEDADWSG
ncbi:uncharacterized protein LOC130498558 [Raphanus sativus]|uniref:Uncharacterized protein LOC130498558 n=1 Tax=Raphanus sativus TaxID=3726 RepID=A0A9W3C939_RAPSA|nr:uncharacterized protein LOC130498558 [Raphanus sativus]